MTQGELPIKLFCFGMGYSAQALVAQLTADFAGVAVAGTRTRAAPERHIASFVGDVATGDALRLLAGTTHALVSIPPGLAGCPALGQFGAELAQMPSLRWVGYLSTIGVYGDANGGWVDEDTPVAPRSERAYLRVAAEEAWLNFAADSGKQVGVFRLPGIYGPGRSVFDALRGGTARRLVKPGQVFNRIHVDDIAGALVAAIVATERKRLDRIVLPAIINVCDDEPSPPQDVIAFAAALLGIPAPPEVAFDASHLSPMGASFYAECKRVRNTRLTQALGYRLRYPTYRDGLAAILDSERDT